MAQGRHTSDRRALLRSSAGSFHVGDRYLQHETIFRFTFQTDTQRRFCFPYLQTWTVSLVLFHEVERFLTIGASSVALGGLREPVRYEFRLKPRLDHAEPLLLGAPALQRWGYPVVLRSTRRSYLTPTDQKVGEPILSSSRIEF